MAKRHLNVWIAYSDIAFVLFVAGLVVAAGYRSTAASALHKIHDAQKGAEEARGKERSAEAAASAAREREQAAESEVRTLQDELSRAFRCSDVQPLFDKLSEYLATRVSPDAVVRTDLCSLTIREDLLQFKTGSDQPIDSKRAGNVAHCVYDALRDFAILYPDAVRNIDMISIDGYTDCQGENKRNMKLGSARANTLYALVYDAIQNDTDRKALLLSKLAVRSFGQQRPVPDSRCGQEGEFAADRRVTIAVTMRPQYAAGTKKH